MHEGLKINARHADAVVLAYVGNLCRIGLEPLFCHHGSLANFGARDDEGVGNGGAHQALFFTNQRLEVLYLKYLGNKAQLIRCGGCENVLSVFKPLVGVGIYIATFDLISDFACRNQLSRLNQAIEAGPDGLENTGKEMLEFAEGTGVKHINHAAAP